MYKFQKIQFVNNFMEIFENIQQKRRTGQVTKNLKNKKRWQKAPERTEENVTNVDESVGLLNHEG